jgi:hypothetical protein
MKNEEYEKGNNLLATPLGIVLHFTFFILNFSLPLSLSSVLNFHYSVRRYGRTSTKEGFA